MLIPLFIDGQQLNPSQDRKKAKKEARIKHHQKQEYEKARKATLKDRFEMQTKEVQERMRGSKKEAGQFYKGQYKDSFLKKLFMRRKR